MPLINFSGLASGIDTNGLIQATSDALRKQRIKPNQDRITELTDTDTAITDLSNKFKALKDSTYKFTTALGGPIAKQATSSSEAVLTATASTSATAGTYDMTVVAKAKNATMSYDTTFTTPSVDLGGTGGDVVTTIGTSSPEVVTITVTAGMTAEQYVTAFNAASARAEASIVNTGTTASPAYKIVISTLNEGTEKGSISSVENAGTGATLLGGKTTDPATDASVTIQGIGTITRSTNQISDIIPGVTLNLVATGNSTVAVSTDQDTTAATIKKLVDAFNEIVAYVAENNQITREENGSTVENTFSPLASTRVDDNAIQAMRESFSASRYDDGTNTQQYKIFADLGITTNRDGTLAFDETKFKAGVSTEPASAKQILQNFADRVATTTGVIQEYTGFGKLFDSTVNNNKRQIDDLNKRIAEAEDYILKQEESMRAQFARLESTISRMQAQQQSLTSALAGLSSG